MNTRKELIPKRRFKEFENSGEWEQLKLRDLGSVVMNKRIFKNQTYGIGEIPFYKIGTFGRKPDAYISRSLFEEYKVKYPYPEAGDILISASGSIGRIVEYHGKDEYFQDSNIVWLQHNGKLNNLFLKQFYELVKWTGLEGSTIKRLYNKSILETEIISPSIDEQTQIGVFFKNTDNLITLQKRKLNKIKNLKSAYLSDMFPKEGEKIPKLRFEGFTEPWKQQKLSDITDYITSSLSVNDAKNIGKFKVYDANGMIGYTNRNKQSRECITIIKDGAGVGRVRLLPRDSAFIGTMGAILTKEKNDISFVYSFLETFDFAQYITGSTIPHIYYKDYGNAVNYFPNYQEQIKIGVFFNNLDNLLKFHQRKLKKLENMKKAYLNEMFV